MSLLFINKEDSAQQRFCLFPCGILRLGVE